MNAVNHVEFNTKGDTLCSCDSDGIVKIWDIRMVEEISQLDGNTDKEKTYSANSCCFDNSGDMIAIAMEDCAVRVWDWNKYLTD